jgi:uncharacterized protein YacL
MLFLEGLRLLLVFAGVVIGDDISTTFNYDSVDRLLAVSICVLAGYLIGGILGRIIIKGVGETVRKLRDVSAAEILGASVLATSGLVFAAAIDTPLILLLKRNYALPVAGVIAWVFAYIGLRVGSAKATQVSNVIGLTKRLAKDVDPNDIDPDAIMLDLSSIMDRTIWVLARSNLLAKEVIVPRIVLDELNLLVESKDPAVSRRANKTLEVLDYVRENLPIITVAESSVFETDIFEEKIVTLASKLKVRLVTSDSRIVELATKQGIAITDITGLANEMAPEHYIGERLKVDLVKRGTQEGQSVGYLDDGDMVVVNDSSHMLGEKNISVEVIQSRRTTQGLLVFAKLTSD